MTKNQLSFYYESSYAFSGILFLPSTCFRSDVNRKTRESRVSICRERLRATCIDQTTRTFSSVRPIEPDRSANPKYDYDIFYRYWAVIECPLSDQFVDLTIKIFLYLLYLYFPFFFSRKIILLSFYSKKIVLNTN